MQIIAIASQRKDFSVNGSPAIITLSFQIVLKVDYGFAIDGIDFIVINKSLKQPQVDPVAFNRLFAGFIDGLAVIEIVIQMTKEFFSCYCHGSHPDMATASNAICFSLSDTWI